jgi:hypothetical protein
MDAAHPLTQVDLEIANSSMDAAHPLTQVVLTWTLDYIDFRQTIAAAGPARVNLRA